MWRKHGFDKILGHMSWWHIERGQGRTQTQCISYLLPDEDCGENDDEKERVQSRQTHSNIQEIRTNWKISSTSPRGLSLMPFIRPDSVLNIREQKIQNKLNLYQVAHVFHPSHVQVALTFIPMTYFIHVPNAPKHPTF